MNSNVSTVESNTTNSTLLFTISLSRPSTSHTTINYATVNGTAIAGSDFVFDSGILFIAAGQTSQTIAISILDDQLIEGNETFQLLLSKPSSNINLINNRATATIK